MIKDVEEKLLLALRNIGNLQETKAIIVIPIHSSGEPVAIFLGDKDEKELRKGADLAFKAVPYIDKEKFIQIATMKVME